MQKINTYETNPIKFNLVVHLYKKNIIYIYKALYQKHHFYKNNKQS